MSKDVGDKSVRIDGAREGATVEAFLLQRHRSLLLRQLVIKTLYRTINLSFLACCVFLPFQLYMQNFRDKAVMASVISSLSFFISILWSTGMKSVTEEVTSIERGLAREVGGRWEDAYIRLKFDSRVAFLLRREPFVWSALVSWVFTLRVFTMN